MPAPASNSEARSLSQRDFLILFQLLDGECHGYGLRKAIAERTGGELTLDPANL